MSIAKSGVVIIFWTILSRVTGFLRDSIMAKCLGSSMMSDVIFAATKLPNSFRRLVGEGAMSSVFVPVFSKFLANDKKNEARFFQSQIFTYLGIFLIILTIICEIFMSEIISFSSPGFKNDPEKFNLTVHFARINFVYLIIISLASLCGGVLNSLGKFGFFAATPIFFNLGLAIVLTISKESSNIGLYYSYSCVAIGFLQLLFMLVACKFYKFGFYLNFSLKKREFGVLGFIKKLGNGLIASGIYQINILVDSIFASMFAGGISYLYYTDRISQLPLTLIGGTMAVGLLPVLSKNVKLKQQEDIDKIHNQAILFVAFATTFCLAIIFSTSTQMVEFIYKRGEFLDKDVAIVARLLEIFSVGFIFTILSKVYNTFLFANLNTKIPMLIGGFSMIVNVIVNVVLYKKSQYFCIAYASTVSAMVSGIASMFIVLKHKLVRFDCKILYKITPLLIIGFLIYKFEVLALLIMTKHGINNPIFTLLIIGVSGILYTFLAILLRVYKISELIVVFKRK